MSTERHGEDVAQTPIGRYRNRLGVELEITGYLTGRNVIGVIYEALIPDQFFGPRQVMITPAGLEECDYVKVEENNE